MHQHMKTGEKVEFPMKCGIVLDSVKWILNSWTKQLGCSKISLTCPQKWERPQKTANITMVLTAIAKSERAHTQLYIVFTRWAKVYMEREVFPLQQLCVSLIYISSNTKLAAVKELRVREAGRGERGEKETSSGKGWRECEKEIRRTEGELRWEWKWKRQRDGRDQEKRDQPC